MPFMKKPQKTDPVSALEKCQAEREGIHARIPAAKARYDQLLEDRKEAMRAGDLNKARTLASEIVDTEMLLDVLEARREELTRLLPQLRGDLKESAKEQCRRRFQDALPDLAPALVALESVFQKFAEISKDANAAGIVGADAAEFAPPPPIIFNLAKVPSVNATFEIIPDMWRWLERCDEKIRRWKEESV